MPTTEPLTLTLRPDLSQIVRSKVKSGEYASELDFVESALEAAIVDSILAPISASDFAHWVATEGVRRYDAMRADPSRGLTSEQVFANLGIEDEDVDAAR